MKRSILLLLFSLQLILGAFAQTDTIFTNSEKILCTVKEVTTDAVKFVYPGEDIINSIYKNTVQKIVLHSGRVQTFAESTSYKTVNGAEDFENVTLSSVESEVKGLFKLGDVSSKAKGTTTFSSMENVKERAIHKLKIVAAMMGANIVYLNQTTTTGNQMGTKYTAGHSTETNLAGVAYSNILPVYDDFIKLLGNKRDFKTDDILYLSQSDFDMSKPGYMVKLQILNFRNENGLILVNGKITTDDDESPETKVYDNLRVVHFTNDGFTLVNKNGASVYNYKFKM